jgi:hypothetical protein
VIARSGDDGRFRIYTETDPASAVLVVHESGVCEIPTVEFQKRPEITLEPWGRIEGTVRWQNRPGANEEIHLIISRREYGYINMIGQYGQVSSDAAGRFVFEKVLPGRVQLSRDIRMPEGSKSGIRSMAFPGLYAHVTALPGESTKVLIGGQGRQVTGRLTGRKTWEGVTIHFHPRAPHIGFPGDEEHWQGFDIFRESAIGPVFFRDKLKPDADGKFEFPQMLPGIYQLFVSVPEPGNNGASRQFQVAAEMPGEVAAPLDIGDISVR